MKFNHEIPQSGGSKNFLKLKDKESAIIICRGEPVAHYVLWEGGKSKEVSSTDPNGKFRFRLNVVVKENGAFVAKILEGGALIYNQLKELNEEYDLDNTFLIIRRLGTGTDTTYTILPSKKEQWTPSIGKQLNAIEMLPLKKSDKIEINSEVDHEEDEEVPF